MEKVKNNTKYNNQKINNKSEQIRINAIVNMMIINLIH